MFGGGTESGINEELSNDRFGMGRTKGFSGSQNQQPRSGPVEFEKDTEDPFAINQFLNEAKRGTKRSGEEDFA